MQELIKIGSHFYDKGSEHFSPEYGDSVADAELLLNLEQFVRLRSASFSGSDLNDKGLFFLSRFSNIENLNLQETEITNEGIKFLKNLKDLNHLRLKGNPQLTNECVSYILDVENLEDLQIHETSINQNGLEKLVVMKKLRNLVLNVWNGNFTYEGLINLSANMPACTILAKGDGEFCNGKFEGKWRH